MFRLASLAHAAGGTECWCGNDPPGKHGETDLHKLRFVARARSLGFSVDECRTLLAMYEDTDRASADVKALAETHLTRIDEKIRELTEMRQTLSHLVHSCAGDDRPGCPILDDLAGTGSAD